MSNKTLRDLSTLEALALKTAVDRINKHLEFITVWCRAPCCTNRLGHETTAHIPAKIQLQHEAHLNAAGIDLDTQGQMAFVALEIIAEVPCTNQVVLGDDKSCLDGFLATQGEVGAGGTYVLCASCAARRALDHCLGRVS